MSTAPEAEGKWPLPVTYRSAGGAGSQLPPTALRRIYTLCQVKAIYQYTASRSVSDVHGHTDGLVMQSAAASTRGRMRVLVTFRVGEKCSLCENLRVCILFHVIFS